MRYLPVNATGMENTHICRHFANLALTPYVVTPYLNRLSGTFKMRGHNIRFIAELTKIIPNCHQILPLI